MVDRVGHVIGNGDGAITSYKPTKGFKVTCNLPPMHVPNVWGTCLVDFKMMRAISDGAVQLSLIHISEPTRPY